MLIPPTPRMIPRRLSMPDPTPLIPAPLNHPILRPIRLIRIPPLGQPRPIHTINTQASEIPLRYLCRALHHRLPVHSADVAAARLLHEKVCRSERMEETLCLGQCNSSGHTSMASSPKKYAANDFCQDVHKREALPACMSKRARVHSERLIIVRRRPRAAFNGPLIHF
jgi:hypothetical protein